MPTRSATPALIPRTYAELRHGVEVTLLRGQRDIDRARVQTYFETGRLIDQHLLLHRERAAYGQQVIPRLARELNLSDRLLYQCLQFARTPDILHARAEFTWAHYRALMQVADNSARKALVIEALKNHLNSHQIETRVREVSAQARLADATADETAGARSPPAKPLPPKRGTPGVYRLAARADALAVDLGFKLYRMLLPEEAAGLHAGTFVRLDGRGRVSVAAEASATDLFTYAASLRRLIDGDTFLIEIEFLPRCAIEQKLRLRGLDCPEISTAEGRAAKRFTEALLARATALTVFTTKPDKYDRYLADVFVTTEDGEVFLNGALLANGHATRKDAWEFGDWEDALK